MTDAADRLDEALDAFLEDVLRRRLSLGVAKARARHRLAELAPDYLTTAERHRRDTAAALAEMAQLGDGRDAAAMVAARRTKDPHQQAMLAQRYRSARRRKKNASRSFV